MKLARTSVITLAALVGFSCLGWAQGEGETLYKQKCAMCHGPTGEGKVGPALKGTKLSEDDVLLLISKGKEDKKAPHKKPMAGLNNDQLKAVAHYVKSLK